MHISIDFEQFDFIFQITDNRALPINRKQKVFPNGTLIIENVERNSDQATYTCVAKNAEGYSARGALEVQVMGKFIETKNMFPKSFLNTSLKRGLK